MNRPSYRELYKKAHQAIHRQTRLSVSERNQLVKDVDTLMTAAYEAPAGKVLRRDRASVKPATIAPVQTAAPEKSAARKGYRYVAGTWQKVKPVKETVSGTEQPVNKQVAEAVKKSSSKKS